MNLRTPIPCLTAALILLTFALPVTGGETDMPEAIRPGTRGHILSCFSGTEPIRQEIEILGILRNPDPAANAILGKILSEPVKSAGIMSGMSGSPVYIDDRLIGAMSFAFPFSTEPICGITPIEAMDQLIPYLPETGQIRDDSRRSRLLIPPFRYSRMLPIRMPLVIRGMPDSTLDMFKDLPFSRSFFSEWTPVAGGISRLDPEIPLRPGSPVAAVLMDGDIKMAATGTATAVNGNRVLAFGHPMMSLGQCDIPMASAEIVTYIPSLANSFKLANIGRVMGSFFVDAEPGVAGLIGDPPRMIPMQIIIRRNGHPASEYTLRLINDPRRTALFSAIGAGAALSFIGPKSDDFSCESTLTVAIRNRENLQISRITGAGRNAYEEMFKILAVIGEILQNPVLPVEIESIHLAVDIVETILFYQLESADLTTGRSRPGTDLTVRLTVKEYRGSPIRRLVKLSLPPGVQPGSYGIKIMDAESYRRFQSEKRVAEFFYRDFADFMAHLDAAGPENILHVLLIQPSSDILVGHGLLPNSPPTMESLNRLPGSTCRIRSSETIILHDTVTFPGRINGKAEIAVEILPE
ncbi:hypothetical protein JXA40_12450 [bacterium]|nr:hypothetical protein [candidate division CSSED10-310 bacterium]